MRNISTESNHSLCHVDGHTRSIGLKFFVNPGTKANCQRKSIQSLLRIDPRVQANPQTTSLKINQIVFQKSRCIDKQNCCYCTHFVSNDGYKLSDFLQSRSIVCVLVKPCLKSDNFLEQRSGRKDELKRTQNEAFESRVGSCRACA